MPTDPISLFFLGCALFAALFLIASMALGGHSAHAHFGHVGHVGHLGGHIGAAHTANVGHTGHVAHTTHTAAHHGAQPQQQGANNGANSPAQNNLWVSVQSALLAVLNLNGLLMFLLVFGLLGYLLRASGAVGWVAALIAAPVGIVAGAALNVMLAKIFFENEAGELTSHSSQIEGSLGTISIAIRPGGIGEIIFSGEAGGRQSLGARAEDINTSIPLNTEVVVTAVENGIATVKPWNQLLAETKANLLSDGRDQSAPSAL